MNISWTPVTLWGSPRNTRQDSCFLGKWHWVCGESELKYPSNIYWFLRIWRLPTWDTVVSKASLGLSLTNLRLWYGKLRNMVTWVGRYYQQARAGALGTSQGVEIEHGNRREDLSENMLRLRSTGRKRLISVRGETVTAWFLFQEGRGPMFTFKGEKKQGQETKKWHIARLNRVQGRDEDPPTRHCDTDNASPRWRPSLLQAFRKHRGIQGWCRTWGGRVGWGWWIGRTRRGEARRRGKTGFGSLISHSVIMDTGQGRGLGRTHLAACPPGASVPQYSVTMTQLYIFVCIILGVKRLTITSLIPHQPLLSSFCWLTMPLLIHDSSFIHFRLAHNF